VVEIWIFDESLVHEEKLLSSGFFCKFGLPDKTADGNDSRFFFDRD
jgi:hypothetical protein